MSMPRYAARRDKNDSPLVDLAMRLGWWLTKLHDPCDWLGWHRGDWHTIEIKDPKKEGWDSEFTPKQKKFHTEAGRRGARILVWRTESDVINDSNSEVSA